MTATYSLPAPCWALTRRVARSMQTTELGSAPVAPEAS
jgi:hypothetical protein